MVKFEMNLITICAIAVLIVLNVNQIRGCDNKATKRFDECVSEFNGYLEKFDDGVERTRSSLDQQCVLLKEETITCTLDSIETCHTVTKASIQGQIDAHLYLCDNLDTYMKYQKCLIRQDVRDKIDECMYNEAHYAQSKNAEQLCSNVQHDVNCAQAYISTNCNSVKAGLYEYNYQKTRVQPILDLINCDFESQQIIEKSKSDNHTAVIVIAIVACLLVLATGVVLFYVFYSKRSSRRHPTHMTSAPTIPTQAQDGSTALENPVYYENVNENNNGQAMANGEAGPPPSYTEKDAPKGAIEPEGEVETHENDITKVEYKSVV